MPSTGIAGSYGSSVFSSVFFFFLRHLHAILYNSCINLHSHQQYKRVPFSPHHLHHLLFVDFLMMAILAGAKQNLIVVLICISLVSNDVEHLFVCLLAICISSLEKNVFRSSALFLLGCLLICLFLILSCMNFLYILEINPCQLLHWQIFSPILRVVFSFCLWFSLLCETFKLNYIPFVCFYIHYSRRSKRILLQFMSKSVLPMFPSKNFIVSSLTFRSLIYLSLILYMMLGKFLISLFYM